MGRKLFQDETIMQEPTDPGLPKLVRHRQARGLKYCIVSLRPLRILRDRCGLISVVDGFERNAEFPALLIYQAQQVRSRQWE